MSKEDFLSRYGSEKHIDKILDSKIIYYGLHQNPSLRSYHIDRMIDQNLVDRSHLLYNTDVNSDQISRILAKTKQNGLYEMRHRDVISAALAHKNSTNSHFKDVLNNSHEKVLHHVFSYVHKKQFPTDFFDNAARHPSKMVRTSVVLHKESPISTLKILSGDKEDSISSYANARLRGDI